MFWRLNIGSYLDRVMFWSVMLWGVFLSASYSHAQSTIIYQDDFESSVSGWSVNDTDFAPLVTNFLGRFADGNSETSRTFNLPANTEELVIEFDLYRFDSWDNSERFGFDRFEVEINGTEIFSLPFPNPQATRSDTMANVEWSHTPLTGREELGFNTGEIWFDQLHRFVITVDNPGATVELTLRADLSQIEPDESAGYDNFLVTAFTDANIIEAVAETFSAIDGDAGGATPSVLASDTLNGVILDPVDVTITSSNSSSPNVSLNAATGFIAIAPNTSAGLYSVEYEICEVVDPSNCASVIETIEVFTAASPPSTCPAGTISVPGVYHIISASGGNNPNQAEGAPFAEGANVDPNNNVAVTFFPTITLDLTGDPAIIVPEGELIEMALSSSFGNNARGEILISADGVTYTSLGTSGNGGSVYGAWTSNTLRYDDFTVPLGGARFIQISHEQGGVISDGVIYRNQCQIPSGEILAVVEDFDAVDGDAGGVTTSVLSSDTLSGVILNPAAVTITSTSSNNPNVTLDTSSGLITVAPNTAVGTYLVEYEICENINPTNCSSVTEAVDVFTSAGFPSTCPIGTSEIPGIYHVVSASGGNNANQAEGAPFGEGTIIDPNSNVAVTFFPTITLDLTGDPSILIPEGEVIDMALSSSFGNNARGEILISADGINYTSLGTSGNGGSVYGAWTSNTLRYDAFTVPAGGARFMQISHEEGGVVSDGVIYRNQCQVTSAPTLVTANKTVAVHDPLDLGLYAIPGNDVIYTVNIDNAGAGDVDSGSLILIDFMPPEVAFFNGDIDDGGPETDPVSFQDTGGSLTFDFDTDVGFSNASTAPTNFADCTYTPINGYDESVTHICFNPKGVMVGQSNWSVSFRARIL